MWISRFSKISKFARNEPKSLLLLTETFVLCFHAFSIVSNDEKQISKFSKISIFFRADYWVSQSKKYCDFCKCWIADNKPVRTSDFSDLSDLNTDLLYFLRASSFTRRDESIRKMCRGAYGRSAGRAGGTRRRPSGSTWRFARWKAPLWKRTGRTSRGTPT